MTEQIKEFARKALPILKRYGYLDNNETNKYFMIGIFVLGLFFGAVVLYGIESDAFKSSINQTVELEPIVNITNAYDFDSNTNNAYLFSPNYTIINNVMCPTV